MGHCWRKGVRSAARVAENVDGLRPVNLKGRRLQGEDSSEGLAPNLVPHVLGVGGAAAVGIFLEHAADKDSSLFDYEGKTGSPLRSAEVGSPWALR